MTTRRQALAACFVILGVQRAKGFDGGTPATNFLCTLNKWIDARNSARHGTVSANEAETWAETKKAWGPLRRFVDRFYHLLP